MAIRVVRLGSPRRVDEGLRIGAVRRPPRGVPKSEYAARDLYDLWYPNLAPSEELLQTFRPVSAKSFPAFRRRYLREMKVPGPRYDIALLAALSHQSAFSLGCYCQEPALCHRSILAELLRRAGAAMLDGEQTEC